MNKTPHSSPLNKKLFLLSMALLGSTCLCGMAATPDQGTSQEHQKSPETSPHKDSPVEAQKTEHPLREKALDAGEKVVELARDGAQVTLDKIHKAREGSKPEQPSQASEADSLKEAAEEKANKGKEKVEELYEEGKKKAGDLAKKTKKKSKKASEAARVS